MEKHIQFVNENKEKIYPNIIVEQIKNDKGTAVKYADGTMIVTQKIQYNLSSNDTWGSMYISQRQTMPNYVVPFLEVPVINPVIITEEPSTLWYMCAGSSTANRPPDFYAVCATPWSNANILVNIIAIGSWK